MVDDNLQVSLPPFVSRRGLSNTNQPNQRLSAGLAAGSEREPRPLTQVMSV